MSYIAFHNTLKFTFQIKIPNKDAVIEKRKTSTFFGFFRAMYVCMRSQIFATRISADFFTFTKEILISKTIPIWKAIDLYILGVVVQWCSMSGLHRSYFSMNIAKILGLLGDCFWHIYEAVRGRNCLHFFSAQLSHHLTVSSFSDMKKKKKFDNFYIFTR